jgi:hypothetical protein
MRLRTVTMPDHGSDAGRPKPCAAACALSTTRTAAAASLDCGVFQRFEQAVHGDSFSSR